MKAVRAKAVTRTGTDSTALGARPPTRKPISVIESPAVMLVRGRSGSTRRPMPMPIRATKTPTMTARSTVSFMVSTSARSVVRTASVARAMAAVWWFHPPGSADSPEGSRAVWSSSLQNRPARSALSRSTTSVASSPCAGVAAARPALRAARVLPLRCGWRRGGEPAVVIERVTGHADAAEADGIGGRRGEGDGLDRSP